MAPLTLNQALLLLGSLLFLSAGCAPLSPGETGPAERDGDVDASQLPVIAGWSVEEACPDPGSLPATWDATTREAIWRLDCYRSLMGLQQPVAQSRLAMAARNHADYMEATGEYGHREYLTEEPSWTGETPWDRIQALNYPLNLGTTRIDEVISRFEGAATPALAVDLWMNSVYHRYPLTSPGLEQVGAGRHGPFDVVELIGPWDGRNDPEAPELQVGVYPAPDQEDVWPSFDSDAERPDPVPGRGLVGAPITATFFGRTWVHNGNHFGISLDHGASWLEDQDGNEVALRMLEPDTDEGTSYAVAAIPLSPLAPLTEYTVRLVADVDGVPWEKTWSFVTGEGPGGS